MIAQVTTQAAKLTGLALAGTGAVLIASAGLLHAQSAGEEAVIYSQCRRPPPNHLEWGRFPECGTDEAATRQLREQLDEATKQLTRQEEEQVERYIDEQFAAPALAAKQTELMTLIDWTARRIEAVLGSDAYQFSGADRAALQQAKSVLQQLIAEAKDRSLTRSELDALKAEVRRVVAEVSGIVGTAPKVVPPDTPAIESLVTRIDALVARVGTVIRDLEREGLAVPRAVREGHAHALELVRESKRTCSTRRPEACANLAKVLDTIDAMRGPLCDLPSELLTFCN